MVTVVSQCIFGARAPNEPGSVWPMRAATSLAATHAEEDFFTHIRALLNQTVKEEGNVAQGRVLKGTQHL